MKNYDYYSGTSGLVLPVANKSFFPPEFQNSSRLIYYASLFNSIEVNSSFYKIPQGKTLAKWATEVPAGFKFTFKLWQGITHNKELVFDAERVSHFIETINQVGDKKGCLLVQFPPSTRFNLFPALQRLIGEIRAADPDNTWKTMLEFRHSSWYNDHVVQFIEDNGMYVVIHDIPASATPMSYVFGDVVYLRFHGPGGRYSGSYPDDFLYEYSTYIHEWQSEGKTVYVYFNNTIGDAVHNLGTLNRMVALQL